MDGRGVQLDEVIIMDITWFLMSWPRVRQIECWGLWSLECTSVWAYYCIILANAFIHFSLLAVMSIVAVDHLESMGCSPWKVCNFEETWDEKHIKRKGTRLRTLPATTSKLVHRAMCSTTWA